jgi:GT2 family glycosyltransferase
VSSGVAVVIVHYRRPDLLRATLEGLAAQTLRPQCVTVVDNGDGSECAEVVEEFGVEALSMGSNAGYAAAAPEGLEAVLIMSHECLLAPDALDRMTTTLRSEASIGAVGPLLGRLDARDEVWSAGGSTGRRTARPFHLLTGMSVAAAQRTGVVDVGWLDGACLLVRPEAAASVAPMGEWWFLYVEELDWLTRMRDAGWRVVCDRRAMAWQDPGMTPPYLEARNLTRWFLRRRAMLPLLMLVLDQARASVRALLTGSAWEARARALGGWHAVTGRLDLGYALRRRSAASR